MAIVKDLARPDSIVDRSLTSTGDSWRRQVEITPSDVTVYSPPLQQLLVGGAGTIEIVNNNGDQSTITAVAGQTILAEVRQVLSTGTTATGLVGMS